MKIPLFIHIGTHKTGSTAIQNFLRQNQKKLQSEGLVYLSIPSQFSSVEKITELSDELVSSFKEYLTSEVKKNNSEDVRFLISTEQFSGDPSVGYANANLIAEYLKKSTDHMDAQIIVYLRRQDEFIESLYTQYIHEGASYSFQSFVKKTSNFSFDWEEFLHQFSIFFGKKKIIVKQYGKEFFPKNDSLIKDFFQIVGVNIHDKGYIATYQESRFKSNRGYSRDALEIARLCNPHFDRYERKGLRRVLQKTSAKQPFEKYSYWSDAMREKFLFSYLESNKTVANEYVKNSSGLLFPYQNVDTDREIYQGLSLDSMTVILFKSMLNKSQIQLDSKILRIIVMLEHKTVSMLKKYSKFIFKI